MPSFAEPIQQASARAWLEVPSSVLLGALNGLASSHATMRWTWLSTFARRTPYVSGIPILGFGVDVGDHGWIGLSAPVASDSASAGG